MITGKYTRPPKHHDCALPTRQNPINSTELTSEEFDRLLDAIPSFGKVTKTVDVEQLRVLLLLIRGAGMRLLDAVALKRSDLIGDALCFRQAKSGRPVELLLAPELAAQLREISSGGGGNVSFFSKVGDVAASVNRWRLVFWRLVEFAALRNSDGTPKRVNPHMLRTLFLRDARQQ